MSRGTGVRAGGEDRNDERKQGQGGGHAGRRLGPLGSLDRGGRRRAAGAVVVFVWGRGGMSGRFARSHGDAIILRGVGVGTAFGIVRGRRGNSPRSVRIRQRRATRVAGFADAKARRQEQRHTGQQHQESAQNRQRRLQMVYPNLVASLSTAAFPVNLAQAVGASVVVPVRQPRRTVLPADATAHNPPAAVAEVQVFAGFLRGVTWRRSMPSPRASTRPSRRRHNTPRGRRSSKGPKRRNSKSQVTRHWSS